MRLLIWLLFLILSGLRCRHWHCTGGDARSDDSGGSGDMHLYLLPHCRPNRLCRRRKGRGVRHARASWRHTLGRGSCLGGGELCCHRECIQTTRSGPCLVQTIQAQITCARCNNTAGRPLTSKTGGLTASQQGRGVCAPNSSHPPPSATAVMLCISAP